MSKARDQSERPAAKLDKWRDGVTRKSFNFCSSYIASYGYLKHSPESGRVRASTNISWYWLIYSEY